MMFTQTTVHDPPGTLHVEKERRSDCLLSEYTTPRHPALLLPERMPSAVKPCIRPTAPNAELLRRIESFLPALERANAHLTVHKKDVVECMDLIQEVSSGPPKEPTPTEPITSLEGEENEAEDEEALAKEDQMHVCMNLGLGVFDVLPPSLEPSLHTSTTPAFETMLQSFLQHPVAGHPTSGMESDDTDSSSSSSSSDSDASDTARPFIETLSDDDLEGKTSDDSEEESEGSRDADSEASEERADCDQDMPLSAV